MAGTVSEDSGVGRSSEEITSGQRCQSSEALAEWRSSDQVQNEMPSTSPPYWDSDDDDDCGPKPSELFGRYTWKIDKFSQINKRELRSNAFEVGGYKWYILIYPQGCDVCNHLSLFLCVANHDKLLPGWSHFAQFTIAVVNKDPKKSKYSDTLHRFWKKEHDWGWKKFMELSKVLDGFIDADTLIIKAQVQVIRERADRPFRCLDCQYRRELVRVYLTNVEQICRRFVEERRGKLGKLIDDKARWSSFCAFWLGIDQNARRRMSREKTESVLKVVVKHFFIEKEVTSTLVMDSLHSGLKALRGQTKSKKIRGKYVDTEEVPAPIVRMEKDAFILVDDVLLLLERAAMEPLPPKDEKGPQNRTKDGGSGDDFTKDSIERDERRLTELGRRTIEIFILAHIFSSKIEVAYQEAIALKRQEELIREEEAACMAEIEQKSKRGLADKDKKSKKKQGKQKRNNRKGKDKGRYEKPGIIIEDKPDQEMSTDGRSDFFIEEETVRNVDPVEDASDVSDSINSIPEVIQPDSERDYSPVNWDTDMSEVHLSTEANASGISGISSEQNGDMKGPSVMDDSSSTCSTDSFQSVVTNGPHNGNALQQQKSYKSSCRRSSQRGKSMHEAFGLVADTNSRLSGAFSGAGQTNDASKSCNVVTASEDSLVHFSKPRTKRPEQQLRKKEEDISQQRKPVLKEVVDVEKPAKAKTAESSPKSPPRNLPSAVQVKSDLKTSAANGTVLLRKSSSYSPQRTDKPAVQINSTETVVTSKPYTHNTIQKPAEKLTSQQVPASTQKPKVQQSSVTTQRPVAQHVPVKTEKPVSQHQGISRPLSAPIIPGPRAPTPVPMVQTVPLLSRSVSAAGRLGPDPSPATTSHVSQSYRNAMMGNHATASSASYTQPQSSNSVVDALPSYSQPPSLISQPIYVSQSSERMDLNSVRPNISFGMVSHDLVLNGAQWMDIPRRDSVRCINHDPSMVNDMQNFDMQQDHFTNEFRAGTSARQYQGITGDEFPHLDIINELLDDGNGIVKSANASSNFHFSNGLHHLNRQFTFPGDIGMSGELPSTSSSRFDRTQSYQDEEFLHNYNTHRGQFDASMIPQAANLGPYPNGHIDGLVPNQWQMAGSDLSYLNMTSSENDGFSYHIPEYSNLASGVNGYTVYRPSNGH